MSALDRSRFFVVGIRPVRFRVHDQGMAVEAFDWDTGEFVRENSYLSKILAGDGDIDELSEPDFDAVVERRRAELEARRAAP